MPPTPINQPFTALAIAQPIGPSEPASEPANDPPASTESGTETTNAGLSHLLKESQSESSDAAPPPGPHPEAQPAVQPIEQPAKQPMQPEPQIEQQPTPETAVNPAEESGNPSTLYSDSPHTEQPTDQTTDQISAQDADLTTEQTTTPATPAEMLEALRANFEGSALPGMLLAVGVLIVMFIMMRRLARRGTRNAARNIDPAEHIAGVHDQALSSIPPLERSVAHAEDAARRLAATLDNKADRLDLLIQEADTKLTQLNTALAQVARNTPVPNPTSTFTPRPDAHDGPRAAQRKIDPDLLDRARVEQDRAERTTNDPYAPPPRTYPESQQPTSQPPIPPASTLEPIPSIDNTPTASDPTHRRIWELSDDGLQPTEIARTLNQPIGQVELILNLRANLRRSG